MTSSHPTPAPCQRFLPPDDIECLVDSSEEQGSVKFSVMGSRMVLLLQYGGVLLIVGERPTEEIEGRLLEAIRANAEAMLDVPCVLRRLHVFECEPDDF